MTARFFTALKMLSTSPQSGSVGRALCPPPKAVIGTHRRRQGTSPCPTVFIPRTLSCSGGAACGMFTSFRMTFSGKRGIVQHSYFIV
jgi:hypothetical protein